MEINIIPKFVDEAASPLAQSVGNTLSDLWGLGIGSHVSLWAQKQQLRQQENFKKYIELVGNKTQEVPEEFLKEPELHIVGPAIEASKYYIESELLREMFANLIASSIDSRKTNITHPSFVEVIKQLSPLDAQNLKSFGNRANFPIVNYVHTIGSGRVNFHENIFLENSFVTELHQISISMKNLERLGIISITYTESFPTEDYDKFYKNEEYLGWKEYFKKIIPTDQIPKELPDNIKEVLLGQQDIIIEKGIVNLSSFGSSLKSACL